MLSTLRRCSNKLQPPSAMLLLRRTVSTSRVTVRNSSSNQGLIKSTRPTPLLQSTLHPAIQYNSITVNVGHRSFSLWNIPLGLMTASPLKRRLALVALGGTSLVVAVVLGPFLLIGLGGIAVVVAFRLWRFKKQLLQQTGDNGGDWPDFLNAFIQQQQVFGKDQLKVQTEAIRRLEMWAQTDQGRNRLIEYGIHPETVIQNVSMRGSYASTTTTTSSDNLTEIKIELDLRNSPGSVLIALAELDKEGNMSITDIRVVTYTGHVLRVPLSITRQSRGGRVIEGEFRDVQ